MVQIKINHIPLEVEAGTKILAAAKQLNIDIPHLCYHPDQTLRGHCRICSVEVVGTRKLYAACATDVWEGMEILTNSPVALEAQKGILEMILSNHNQDCLSCARNQNCELQALSYRFNMTKQSLTNTYDTVEVADDNPSIVRDLSKCVKCGRCVKACSDTQGIGALTYSARSESFRVSTAFLEPLNKTSCVLCGQCIAVCPVAAITERDDTEKVFAAIDDTNKHVIVQVAPSVRVALGDGFGLEKGSIVTGQMVAALRQLGFDQVFDTNFAADVTIMEEGSELLHRLTHGGVLPMITSCSPGWVNFAEKNYGDHLAHLSTAKSPQQIFGAISKEVYPSISGIDKKDIVTVSIMPCTAKKYEAKRPEMGREGIQDVDYVLTTRELIQMIQMVGIDFQNLEESEFDKPYGLGTGAGAIFGVTGGVMEAALRTAYEKYTGKALDAVDFADVRGFEGIKEATIDLGDTSIKVAVAHGLANAKIIMEQVTQGNCPYSFIEIMACPGGCIGGGGQPIRSTMDVKQLRKQSIYQIDRQSVLRKSHENPDVIALYDKYLESPLSELAHRWLHTHHGLPHIE